MNCLFRELVSICACKILANYCSGNSGYKKMNQDQLQLYSRQIKLPQVGVDGQERLLASTALIIGMGGLGSPAALYLASAGVGHLVISDYDRVELSNLQRQIIHRHADIGELKAHSASKNLHSVNPDLKITAIDWELDEDELLARIAQADVVLDCSDNFPTRYAVNRACMAKGVPLVSGAAIRMEGQLASYLPAHETSPCYQCLYQLEQDHAPTCSEEGVVSPLVGIIGSMQAMHAMLILLGQTRSLLGKLHLFDAQHMEWRSASVSRDPACPVCKVRP